MTPIVILNKYADFANVFSPHLAAEFLGYIGINDYSIHLINGKQLLYEPIYSLKSVKLKILKIYIIKTNLGNDFIKLSKFFVEVLILFARKSDSSLHLCVSYQGLNNFIFKNKYLLLLINESLDWLGWAKRFTQLTLVSAYHQMRIREKNEWKTVFCTQYVYLEYQVILFDLSNTLAIF